MNISESLIRYRTSLGLSQKAAAARLGIPVRTWQDWEAGRRGPRGVTEQALVSWIGIRAEIDQGAKQFSIKHVPDGFDISSGPGKIAIRRGDGIGDWHVGGISVGSLGEALSESLEMFGFGLGDLVIVDELDIYLNEKHGAK